MDEREPTARSECDRPDADGRDEPPAAARDARIGRVDAAISDGPTGPAAFGATTLPARPR